MWNAVGRRLMRFPLVAARGFVSRSVIGAGLVSSVLTSHSRNLAMSAAPTPGKVKLALLQVAVGDDKSANLVNAEAAVRDAAAANAKLICLCVAAHRI